MAQTRFKSVVYDLIAHVAKAAANPVRLEILDLLAQAPRTVEAVAEQIDQSVANTSHHLQVLRSARLVDADKAGLFVTYRLTDEKVGAFLLQLRGFAQARLEEIDQVRHDYFERRGALDAIGHDDLIRRVRAGDVTVIDVRPGEEFASGHIPGAISIPLNELKKRLRDLPKSREVVAYCRGPYCVMATDAVALLRTKGYRAQAIELGVPEWRAKGWRVDSGGASRA